MTQTFYIQNSNHWSKWHVGRYCDCPEVRKWQKRKGQQRNPFKNILKNVCYENWLLLKFWKIPKEIYFFSKVAGDFTMKMTPTIDVFRRISWIYWNLQTAFPAVFWELHFHFQFLVRSQPHHPYLLPPSSHFFLFQKLAGGVLECFQTIKFIFRQTIWE